MASEGALNMTKSLLSLILLPLLLAGCAQMPDTQVTRHQIDDLRDHDICITLLKLTSIRSYS